MIVLLRSRLARPPVTSMLPATQDVTICKKLPAQPLGRWLEKTKGNYRKRYTRLAEIESTSDLPVLSVPIP
jgi:hypothetical protein